MAYKLVTPSVNGPFEHSYFRYMMDKPSDLFDIKHPCHLKLDEPIYVDVETHNTDYSKVRTVQCYQEQWPQVITFDVHHTSVFEVYDVIKDMHVISHMSTMELSCFQNEIKPADVSWFDYRPKCPFDKFSDTFLLARRALYNQIESFGLDKVAAHIHGTDFYKDYATSLGLTPAQVDGYKKYMQRSFLDTAKSDKMNNPLALEQLVYGALDVLVMPKIYNELKHVESEFIITLDYMFIKHCTQYQHAGLHLDLDNWNKHMTEQKAIMETSIDFLPVGFNCRSYKQVRALLNSLESDDAYLSQVIDGSDLLDNGEEASQYFGVEDPAHFKYRQLCAKHIRAYRSAVKRTEYLRSYMKQHDKFGRVKGYVSPRTISGRVASDECNMTNIPRSLKNLFKAPEGKFMLYADYSQLELRMTAAVLNEHAMIEKFMNDEDVHVYAASQVYEKAPSVITHEERFIGKFFNFSACLTGNSSVETVTGKVPIKDIKVGDYVFCMNTNTKKYEVRPVEKVYNHGVKEVIRVHWESANQRKGFLECTPDHLLFTSEGWVEAQNCVSKKVFYLNHTIKKEEYYTAASYNHKITHIEVMKPQTVYDIDVKEHHNFIANELVVHNSYGAGTARLCSMLLKEAGVYMSEDDMRPLHQNWKKTWPQITNWQRLNGRSRTNEGVTLLGRHYKAKMYTDLNAIQMQGSSAEVFKLAHLYMAKNKPDIEIGAAIHDSFIVLDEADSSFETAVVVAWSKLTAWFEVIQNAAFPTLKMPIEVFVGTNWGEIDGDGNYYDSYKIEGTHEQYLQAKSIVTSGRILDNIDFLKAL